MAKSLKEYMEEYAAGHTQRGTKLTHMVGIPMIVASLPMLPFNPLLGGGLFVGGWILQFIGHYVFEHNDPKFFGDPLNLLVGVIWAAVEWAHLVGIELPIPGAEAVTRS
ncbi:MAG: DUF962 domain-containing protein [Polyangia bacterium]|jgi:uncharacterized membrane protein YGL010W